MQMSMNSELPEILPPLREGVVLQKGGMDFNNSPTWVVQDLLNNRFFHLGWREHEILRFWQNISPDELINTVKSNSLAQVSADDITQILKFLSQNCLIEQSFSTMKSINEAQTPKKMNWFLWLAKNYLFFRIPLVKPNRFLNAIYPYMRFALGKGFALSMMLLGIIAIIFTLRQWDQFTHTFFALFSIQYIILYGIALILAKSCHELGHALMCKKYALNVPTMGVAFLVMFPMLYTDTGESWKINDPKERVTIALAGVITETYIAIFALCAWLLMPEGAIKSICFFLATYSLMTTYIINISPFLRFDGYHVLSDVLSMRNLQTRAFALTKWKLREVLFGLNMPAPEQFSQTRQRVLITYAVLTWIYRFVLFLGIAIMVYYLFFKALGIILFVIEIVYFILHPIYRELKVWWSMKSNISLNKNTFIFSVIILILIGLFFIPWQSQISLPATLSYQTKPLYTEIAARVISVNVKKGESVKKGQLLAQLKSDQLDFQIAQANEKLKQLIWQQRNSVHFQTKLDQQQVLQTQINHTNTQLNQLLKQQDKLVFTAPFDGVVESLSEDLHPDAWLKAKQALMLIVNNKTLQLRAYTTADDQDQLKLNQKGYFVPENIDLAKIPVEIRYIVSSHSSVFKSQNENKANLSYIHEAAPLSAYHASNFGGSIAVNPDKEGKLTPQENVFLILLTLSSPLPYELPHVVRGKVFIDIERKSLAARLWQQVLILWVKESGF